ncbi:alcohol dehydrogenase catalytic domain-containing protein [Sphingobium phenoxybenzoativorans]|uniref:alcohol dehydrogenase catalytic domain-containing protein n=1 Tax=Sphingobium phenoxybenzoativorans TaxID=1592790 RepID=UPI0008721C2E|nr:alcohol dehydrogenase catalytic domain-containing protein [Sphingobium phenoxybenzoativorans]
MRSAVYHGPLDIRCEDIPEPAISAEHQMLVEVSATSICGSDLHIFRGTLDAIMEKGKSTTGHELIGIVAETASGVTKFKRGDRITIAYSASCGDCYMCHVGQTAHCETTKKAVYGFGVPFGDLNGTHAEALIVPYADAHAMSVPEAISDAAALTLSCNLPSAMIALRLAAIEPGENVAIVGCGPTGLMTLDLVLGQRPGKVVALDNVLHRLAVAEKKGAAVLNVAQDDWLENALAETGGRGFDKVIEVVGTKESLNASLALVRPGGTVAAIGVFCEPEFTLNTADVFLRDISLHMNGFANVQPLMWDGLRLLERAGLQPEAYFSHEFSLNEIDAAFVTFNDKADNALKMLIRP